MNNDSKRLISYRMPTALHLLIQTMVRARVVGSISNFITEAIIFYLFTKHPRYWMMYRQQLLKDFTAEFLDELGV